MKFKHLIILCIAIILLCVTKENFNWDFMDNNVPENLYNQGLIHPLDEIATWIETHYDKNIKDANNIAVDQNINDVMYTFVGTKQFGLWKYNIGHFLSEDDRLRSLKGLLRTRDKIYNIWTLQTDDYKKVNTIVTNYDYQILGILKPMFQNIQFEQLKQIAKINGNAFIVAKIDLLMGLQKNKPLNWRFIYNRYQPHLCVSKSDVYNPSRGDNYVEEHICGELMPDQQLWSVEGDRIISKDDPSLCLSRDICHNTLKKCNRSDPNQSWAFKDDGSFYNKMDEHECEDDDRYVFGEARY